MAKRNDSVATSVVAKPIPTILLVGQRALPNFYDLVAGLYAHRAPTSNDRDGVSTGFKRWEQYWAERLYPSGDFGVAARAYAEYFRQPRPSAKVSSGALSQNVTANWQPLGPFSNPTPGGNFGGVGRVEALAFDPAAATNNTFYACALRGGVWKTTNGGANWTSLTDKKLPTLTMSAIAVDPGNGNNIYVGISASLNYIKPSALCMGIYRTIDGGLTWTKSGAADVPFDGGFQTIGAIVIDPNDSTGNTAYIATSEGIYKSVNAKTNCTWTLMKVGFFRTVVFKPGTSVLYAAGTDIFTSTDGGATWQQMVTLTFSGQQTVRSINLGVSASQPSWLYATIFAYTSASNGNENFFVLAFNGTSWTQMTSPYPTGSPDRDALAVSPLNANVLFVGGISSFRSVNGGSIWTSASAGGIHNDVQDLKFLPGSGSILFAGTDGGVSTTANALRNPSPLWTEIDQDMQIAIIYNLSSSATSPDLILTGHQDGNGNLYDGAAALSQRWKPTVFGDGFEQVIDWFDSNIMYCTYNGYNNGAIMKSIDRGKTWKSAYNSSEGALMGAALVMDPIDHLTLYQGRRNLWKTKDGAATWARISNFNGEVIGDVNGVSQPQVGVYQAIKALAVAPTDSNVIYLSVIGYALDVSSQGTDRVRLFRTLVGGGANNWTEITPPFGVDNYVNYITGIAVDPSNASRVAISLSGYAAGLNVKISTDAGATWIDYSDGLPNMPCNHIVWQQGTSRLYLATDVGVYFRDASDALSVWSPFMDNLPNVNVQWLEINSLAGKIRAATFGRGLWESVLASLPPAAQDLTQGKVVFVSNRVVPQQLFIQNVTNFGLPPVQVTSGPLTGSWLGVRHPSWSPDGRFIAYTDRDIVGNDQVGVLTIIEVLPANGVQVRFRLSPNGNGSGGPGYQNSELGYPEWSPTGDRIVLTTWGKDFADSDLKMITFTNGPYEFANYTITTILSAGMNAADADFSPDGTFLYFGAQGGNGTLWRMPANGGVLIQLSDDKNAPLRRGFAVSVSPDGQRVIYNSELWREDAGYLDEELLEYDMTTKVVTRLTSQSGNQYGAFAKGGSGQYVAQSSASIVAGSDNAAILLCKPSVKWSVTGANVELDVSDSAGQYSNFSPSWWIA